MVQEDVWKQRGLTFSRIDIDPWLVEHLLILPVPVPQNSFGTEKQNHGSAAVHQYGPWGPSSQADIQGPQTYGHQQAKAHAGDVQYSLCDHKPHIEKEICGREERDGQQAKRKHHHILSGGQWSPALVVLFGTILSVIHVSVCVGIVHMFMIVPRVTVSVAVPIPAVGALMRFAIDLLALSCVVCPQAEPCQQKQPNVESCRMKISPVSKGPNQRQGIHRPIEAQRVWEKEEPKVGSRQVEEGQRPGEERGRVGRRVVRVGEVGGFVAHPVESAGQQDDSPGCQQDDIQQQVDVLPLQESTKSGIEPAVQQNKTKLHLAKI